MEEVLDGDLASPGDDALLGVPSGQAVALQDVIWNVRGVQGLTLRFRFVAPDLAALDLDAALADMQALCESYAIPRSTDFGPAPQQIIISLADVALPFGEAAPDAVQYFEAYRIENGACIWEIY
ncbi:MAG: hypothetical protein RLZZ437_2736 [Pseudomonadota bacterium]|jgi:hypothetical protein